MCLLLAGCTRWGFGAAADAPADQSSGGDLGAGEDRPPLSDAAHPRPDDAWQPADVPPGVDTLAADAVGGVDLDPAPADLHALPDASAAPPDGPCPLSLQPLSAPVLSYAAQLFNQSSSDATLSKIQAYALPGCSSAPPAVLDLVALLPNPPRWRSPPQQLSRAQLVADSMFLSTSQGGPALLAALDAWAGSSNMYGTLLLDQLPCNGCTLMTEVALLVYLDVGKVVVLEGELYWDS